MSKTRICKITLILVVFFIFILLIIPTCIIRTNRLKKENRIYSLFDFLNASAKVDDNINCDITIAENEIVVYDSQIPIHISLNEKIDYTAVKIYINNICFLLNSNEQYFDYDVVEGKNNINVSIFLEGKKIGELNKNIFYIREYQHNFLDEKVNKGMSVHFVDLNTNPENCKDTIKYMKMLGVKNIRTDIYKYMTKNNNFSFYDNWIDYCNKNDIDIMLILNGFAKKIDTDEKLNEFKNFFDNVFSRYKNLKYIEVLNEPNILGNNWNYYTDNDLSYYSQMIKYVNKKTTENDVKNVGGALGIKSKDNQLSQLEFIDKMKQNGAFNYLDAFSYHYYDMRNVNKQNERFKNNLCTNNYAINNVGGFIRKIISEYGLASYQNIKISEEDQAYKLVQQTVLIDHYNIDGSYVYCFLNAGNDENNGEDNFGLMYSDYTPKKSYYSMKNYYQNTNGAEYIGAITTVADGLEFHVYDKDGVPIIVCWSNDNSKTIEIPYSGFTAYDLYGNENENANGKLSITSSPVYLKNADRSYFYRAISNTAVSAYDEFLTNYADYLDSSDEMITVKNKVNQMKKYAEGLTNGGEVSETEALSKMKEHFAIGDMILKAYKDGNLSCEYVKLSSMLDQLNTTAYAFEDLVTITAKDVSNAKLTETEKIMNTFENKVSANVSVDMVYPNKIKTFAKDYYDTSSYINGLEEDNPIKNGLIISKGLHAYYLAGWADSFADCYLETPEITIQYSNTELTNEDVVVTLETNVPIEMEGSNQYTFTENGSFTFKYTLYGEQKEITAVVDWIDKDAPVINGIDEREDETEQVTLTVTDANLDTVTVTKDGQDVLFNDGDVLIEKGEYEVVARDRAGNSSKRSFKIVDYIESNKTYYVSPNGNGDGSSEDASMSVKDLNKLKLYAGDKILLKSGEKYSVNIECKRKGSPDNRIVISNYGEGALPVVNGSLDLVSNLEISNLRFTNSTESCLVTNYDYCENVKIENCIFDNVSDSAIYLNRQVSNFEITNCIFKNCKNAGITMKNDLQNLMVSSIKIKNNIFVNLSKSIDLASESADNTFEKVEISENYFIVQTSDEAVIKIGKIVADKFDVCVYSNLFYSFSKAYKVCEDSLKDIKDHLLCDYNTFYAYKESKYLNDITDIKTLNDEYGNEANSNVIVIDREKYDVYECLNTTLKLDDKEQILSNLTEKIDIGNRRMQIDVVGNPDKIIKNKVMGLEEMRKSDIEEVTDSSVADEVLPLAGWQKVSIAIISIIVITGLFSAGKYSKYKKDTKKQIRRK